MSYKNEDPMVAEAMEMLEEEKFSEAIPLLEALIERGFERCKLRLGDAYWMIGNTEVAVKFLKEAATEEEADGYAEFYIGHIYDDKKDEEKAARYYRIAGEKGLSAGY